ncbi:MAG: Ni/Fe hydrogenase subunit alpha, partial [bacterium]|nr:Ni/Fe hydrogenase subunit alpha [bacterium]
LREDLKWGLEAAVEVTRWVAEFEYSELETACEMVALTHDNEYPMNEGRIASTASPSFQISASEFEQHFAERQVPHSTALQAVRIPQETAYYVGPLARLNLNRDKLFPVARQLSEQLGIVWPCFNRFKSIVARSLEVVHAFEEALQIVNDYRGCSPNRIRYDYRDGQGTWVTEAPRGLIYHRYGVNAAGEITAAKIVPPTSQNQLQIESDLRELLPSILGQEEARIARDCENLIRTYDPCISCSTHFLRLKLEHCE